LRAESEKRENERRGPEDAALENEASICSASEELEGARAKGKDQVRRAKERKRLLGEGALVSRFSRFCREAPGTQGEVSKLCTSKKGGRSGREASTECR